MVQCTCTWPGKVVKYNVQDFFVDSCSRWVFKGELTLQRNLALMNGEKPEKHIGKSFRKIRQWIREIWIFKIWDH